MEIWNLWARISSLIRYTFNKWYGRYWISISNHNNNEQPHTYSNVNRRGIKTPFSFFLVGDPIIGVGKKNDEWQKFGETTSKCGLWSTLHMALKILWKRVTVTDGPYNYFNVSRALSELWAKSPWKWGGKTWLKSLHLSTYDITLYIYILIFYMSMVINIQ